MLNRKISIHGLIAGGIILVSLLLRLVLVGLGWPLTNSDEGVWGIMALHIAYHGDDQRLCDFSPEHIPAHQAAFFANIRLDNAPTGWPGLWLRYICGNPGIWR